MKNCAILLALCSFPLAALSQSAVGGLPVVGRTIYHTDDSRTESVRDPNTRELTEMTYTPAGQLTVKKVFLLNEKGEPMQGNVYDGQGNLVARCQSFYDEFGRRKEDHLTNLKGEVFQKVVHDYGKDGKPLTPKVVNINTQAAPTMKAATVDFTAPGTGAPSTDRFAPQAAPTSGANPQPTAPVPQEEKPKSFFKKLFKK